jgi:glyoxylase-like metal-dependent hydrolase (beta-lactamase superfamily II)
VATLFGDRERYPSGLRRVAPGVHAWLQPNGAWGESNAGLIVGTGESLLVDTLWDLPLTRRMLDAMGPLVEGAPIRTLVNTHGDGDHWFGNELVGAREIVATNAAAAHEMRAVTPVSMVALRRLGSALELAGRSPIRYPARGSVGSSGRFLRGWVAPYEHRDISLTRPTRTFSGRLELDVGGRKVELIEVGPAHTHGDLIVHVPDARVVFAADVAFVGSTPVMWVGPLAGWLRALDTIEALEPEVVVPGHGPVTDLAGLVTLREYWAYLDAAARPRLAAGLAVNAVAREVVSSEDYSAQPFASWECPERAVINVHTLDRHRRERSEPRPPAVVAILGAVGRLAAELPGRAPAALHPPA